MARHSFVALTLTLLVAPTFALRTAIQLADILNMHDDNEAPKECYALEPSCTKCLSANADTCFPRDTRHDVLFGSNADALGNAFECLYDACNEPCGIENLDCWTNMAIAAGNRHMGKTPDCTHTGDPSHPSTRYAMGCVTLKCVHSALGNADGFFSGSMDEMKKKIKAMRNCMRDAVSGGDIEGERIETFVNGWMFSFDNENQEHAEACGNCVGKNRACLPQSDGKAGIFGGIRSFPASLATHEVGTAFGCLFDACSEQCPLAMLRHEWDSFMAHYYMVVGTDQCEKCAIPCIPTTFFEGSKAQMTSRIMAIHECVESCKETGKCTEHQLGAVNLEINRETSWFERLATSEDSKGSDGS